MHLRGFTLSLLSASALASLGHAQGGGGGGGGGPPPPPPPLIGTFPNDVVVPAGNPQTPEKILLGFALFFEEQLSSDDTMACATCHLPDAGGGDPRAGLRAPGDDGLMNTLDDEFGSPGTVPQDRLGNFREHPAFAFGLQATGRNSPSAINAAFFNTQFWDRRAGPVFHDLAGNVVLANFASLETQAVEPPLSGVEMSRAQRSWDQLVAKLAAVRPLDLARNVPPALERFLDGAERYGPLFRKAFGTDEITRERIAMAIASYERTLVPDRSPFDLGTMTANQRHGFDVFQRSGLCEVCHTSSNAFFTDGARRTIFLADHPRAVKTPTLRNVGLRRRFMSSGEFTSLDEVLDHYESIGFVNFANVLERVALRDFLANALTDPRAANREPPFDRPTLRSEAEPHGSNLYGTATEGSGRFLPEILADTPANLGSTSFRIGLGGGLGGATAVLAIGTSRAPPGTTWNGVPVYVEAGPADVRCFVLTPGGPGQGAATFHADLPADPALVGREAFAQWFVLDPGARGGIAVSQGAGYELFSRSFRPRTRRR
jgi:cytochrome c peroxidase